MPDPGPTLIATVDQLQAELDQLTREMALLALALLATVLVVSVLWWESWRQP
jgi:hypothetical protein